MSLDLGAKVDEAMTLGKLRAAFARRADVRVAIVFGSVARGTARPDSDVDVAVLAPGVDLLALAADLARAIGADVDLVQLGKATIPLLSVIVREGIPVHEGTPGAEATWRASTLAMLETDEPAYRRMADAWLSKLAGEPASG